jgi:hypothetical protein
LKLNVTGVVPDREPALSQFDALRTSSVQAKADVPVVTDSDWGSGGTPPCCCAKLRPPPIAITGPTISVTLAVTGLLTAGADATEIAPVYVPAANPAGLTDTERFAGVVAPEGDTDSQFPPEFVITDEVMAIPDPAVTSRFCAAGAGPPDTALNVNEAGANWSTGPTLNVTASDWDTLELPGTLIVIEPL